MQRSNEQKQMESIMTPEHYNNSGVDVIDLCEAYNLSFVKGNIVKYICRAGKKEGETEVEALLKAKSYLDRALQELELPF